MSAISDPFGKVAESVADGDPIDWDAIEALDLDEPARRLFAHLRIVAGVAAVHRSGADDGAPSQATFTPPPENVATPRHTRRWGHLLLVRRIGEGAFGEVYEAHDSWLDHPRALKLVRPEVAGRVSTSDLLHEARKLVRVRHPNIVTVHGADQHDGQVGFWMDLVEGQTLAARLNEGRLSAGEAAHVGQELCRALAVVHHANMVHRDIKAQNVMRAKDGGRIILMDFGAGDFFDALEPARIKGTPLYLAPELFEHAPASRQTDIYALGVLLYHLVTARFPVEGTSFPALAEAHRQGQRRHLRDDRPDLPDAFIRVVERAIDPDPRRRFESAGAMLAALEEQSERAAVAEPGPRPSTAVRPATWEQASRLALAAIGLLAAIELMGYLTSALFEEALHVNDAAFKATPREYFHVGWQALLPFAIYWVGGIILVGIAAGARLLFKTPLKRLSARVRRTTPTQPSVLAASILCAGAVCWAVALWMYWDLFALIMALQSQMSDASLRSLLGREVRLLHVDYSSAAAWLTFALLFAVLRWFPTFEQGADDPSLVRQLKWTTLALIFLVITSAVAPRRLAWDPFRLVTFAQHPAMVIRANESALLLYPLDERHRTPIRVDRSDPDLADAEGQRPAVTR